MSIMQAGTYQMKSTIEWTMLAARLAAIAAPTSGDSDEVVRRRVAAAGAILR